MGQSAVRSMFLARPSVIRGFELVLAEGRVGACSVCPLT